MGLKYKSKNTFDLLQTNDSEKIKVGQKVLTIGNPFGFNGTLTLSNNLTTISGDLLTTPTNISRLEKDIAFLEAACRAHFSTRRTSYNSSNRVSFFTSHCATVHSSKFATNHSTNHATLHSSKFATNHTTNFATLHSGVNTANFSTFNSSLYLNCDTS